jgi:hypothetical protein
MKKSLGVIGVGSAGICSISHFINILGNDWDIVSIHDPKIDPIGIGESTNPSFMETIENGLNFSMLDDLKHLDATYKFATRYKEWKSDYIDSPLIAGRCAIHFNTHKLRDFAFERFAKLWPEKFKVLEGNVDSVEHIATGPDLVKDIAVKVVVDNVAYQFDYIIDCRGFPKDYSDYTVCNMPVNHGLVHNKMIPGDWNYTGHRATLHGWMFEIPLQTRQSYGYLFNDTITTVEEAKKNFSKIINVPINELDSTEYKFKSYYCNTPANGRIFKNGNSFGFFEPMSATSLWMYAALNNLYETNILARESGNPVADLSTNEAAGRQAQLAQELICFFYHGGSDHATDFWNHATNIANEFLANRNFIQNLTATMSESCKNGTPFSKNLPLPFGARPHYYFDKRFKHHYFTDPE